MQNEDKFAKKVEKKYGSNLFHDISEYVEHTVAPKFHHGFMCVSFQWGPTFGSANDVIQQLYNEKHTYKPDAMIMNMNIHQFNVDDHEMDKFVNKTDELYEKYKPLVLYHAPSAVDEHNPSYGSTCTNLALQRVMRMFYERLPKWKFVSHYLNYWDESVISHKQACSMDGIHFFNYCSHSNLMVQWDFNWLRKYGIIDSYTNSGQALT